jgi:predicted  nucleic acid-binding Zn-ribbon protein
MKKCAKCGAEYADEFDGCPECAKREPKAKAKASPKATAIGCLVVLILGGLVVWGFNYCAASGAADLADNPALVAKAQTAIDAAGSPVSSLVDHITAHADGTVIITLNQTSAALAGSAGANGAEKVGAAYNSVVLAKVPAATSVSTFDADNKMLELTTRK